MSHRYSSQKNVTRIRKKGKISVVKNKITKAGRTHLNWRDGALEELLDMDKENIPYGLNIWDHVPIQYFKENIYKHRTKNNLN